MKLSAHQFAKPCDATAHTDGACHHFGVDRERTAARLESLAADIRAERCVLQRVTVTGEAPNEDFTMTTLAITLAERAVP